MFGEVANYGGLTYSIRKGAMTITAPNKTTSAQRGPEGNPMTRSYEIHYEVGAPEVLADVTSYTVDNGLISFHGADRQHGSSYLIKAVRVEDVSSFGVVTDPEVLTTPKYSFNVTLQDGTVKAIQADLFRVSGSADNVVYEFFTQLAGDFNGKSREEFTIPFASVKFVERVDPAKATATAAVLGNGLVADAPSLPAS